MSTGATGGCVASDRRLAGSGVTSYPCNPTLSVWGHLIREYRGSKSLWSVDDLCFLFSVHLCSATSKATKVKFTVDFNGFL